jgi:hypothetical protein
MTAAGPAEVAEQVDDRRGGGRRLPAVPEGAAMTTATELLPSYLDVTRLAIASFLARYCEPTLTAYKQDLKAVLAWCQQ